MPDSATPTAPLLAEIDVIVTGSGAAGLTAALTAAEAGLEVEVVEKTGWIGGTTAVSGGVIWVPNNHHMKKASLGDSVEEALEYMLRLGDGRADPALVARYLEEAPGMLAFVEERLDEPFHCLETYPDYQPELPGGKEGGRSLDNPLLDTGLLGEWRSRLRVNRVNGRSPITIQEAMDWGVFWNPMAFPAKEVYGRSKRGLVHGGAALVGRLLRACLERGVRFRMETRAQALLHTDHPRRVTGLLAIDSDGRALRLMAKRGVVLATGGFEWDKGLGPGFLRGVPSHPSSPRANTGDGLRMAMDLGAGLANMAEAWWCPSVVIPGEQDEQGSPLYRGEFSIRCLPHTMIVNQAGRRFVNEALNYNDVTRAFFDFDPVSFRRPNTPAWLIADGQYLERYIFLAAVPGRPVPDWIPQAPTLKALADKLGIDPEGLADEVARFNGFCQTGQDLDFARGQGAFERFYGDPRFQPNPNLGTLGRPPFVALPIHPGTLGTKGGPRTDGDAQVLDTRGRPISGLYAAGNVAASICGPGYPGAGATIGAAMTFGWLAARHLALDDVTD